MTTSIMTSGGSNAAHNTPPSSRSLPPLQSYAVRTITRRAQIGLSQALLIAELAGIFREGAHE